MKTAARNLAHAVWRVLRRHPPARRGVHRLAKRLTRHPLGARVLKSLLQPRYLTPTEYRRWIAECEALGEPDRAAIRRHIAALGRRPTISVLMPAYETDIGQLQAAIGSVKAQLYPHWELCIADDASRSPEVWRTLEAEAAGDGRIRIVRRTSNGHISAATNSALALATGEFVAFMDHEDLLAETALYRVAAELDAWPEADLVYSDEDKIDARGHRFEPHFKSDWNPELALSQNLVSHLGVYRKALVDRLGGLRVGFEGSQDHDLVLRVAELTSPDRIRHIPAVLYHWRQQAGARSFSEGALEQCAAAARRAVREHLDRTGAGGADVQPRDDETGWVRVVRPAPDPAPLVSVIVPTRDRADLLEACVTGVLKRTDYPALEVIIADNDSAEPETHALFARLAADPRVRVLPAPGPFNYSAINNAAVAAARGEVLVLLNNDVAVLQPGWLKAMVAQAVRPEVGAVGARLLYPDGRVQHAGVVLGIGGDPPVAGHVCAGAPASDAGYFFNLRLARNVSAVTAACMALRKAVFEQVGGFDAVDLAVAYNDVDLCLKIRAAGLQIIWEPQAELIHQESASRGDDGAPEHAERFGREVAVMRRRWGAVLDADPFYNPNFDRSHGDYRLATPPNLTPPWARFREPAA